MTGVDTGCRSEPSEDRGRRAVRRPDPRRWPAQVVAPARPGPMSACCCAGPRIPSRCSGRRMRTAAPRGAPCSVPLAARLAGFPGRVSVRCLNTALDRRSTDARVDALRREQLAERAPRRGLLDLMAAADDGWVGGKAEHLGEPTGAELVAEVYQRLGLLERRRSWRTATEPLPAAPVCRARRPQAQARLRARAGGRAPRSRRAPRLERRPSAARLTRSQGAPDPRHHRAVGELSTGGETAGGAMATASEAARPPVVGVLLAGGQARRMGGGDKCLRRSVAGRSSPT